MSVGAVNKQTGERIPTAGMPAVDSVLSGTSTNPVQNRVAKAALDEKADTDIVASDFDATASYTAGNYCIYEGRFYKFKANHSGAWAAADVDEIKIAGELSALKSGLTKNDLGSGVDISSYATTDNLYTCPSDGYILIDASASESTWANVEIYGSISNNALVVSATDGRNGIFVRKGMRVRKSGGDGSPYIYFYPLQ